MKATLGSMRTLVAKVTLVAPADLSPSRDLLMEGILDSLQVVQLADLLESRFGILLDPFDLSPENFASLECLLSLVERKLGLLKTETSKARRAI